MLEISPHLLQKLIDLNIISYSVKDRCLKLCPSMESMSWDISLGFEHVAIRQKKNLCKSRLDVDIESEVIKGVKLAIPMIAANMSTVCDPKFCIKLGKLGGLGVMHRAASEDYILKAIEEMATEIKWVAGSIGVGDSQLLLADRMIERGCNIIFIDIAHGYSDSVLITAKLIKDKHPDVKMVIGNTTNTELLWEAREFADAIKVGIATGFACETKNTAGCTEKQFSAILKFKNISKELKIPVIGDGGIREAADMVKAIGAGANSIMAGSIFARCPESAAEIQSKNGALKKVYAGMSSRYVQLRWKGGLKDGTCPEGGVRLLDLGESVEKMFERWSGALKSGITYAGGKDIQSFQNNVEFVRLAT